MACSPLGTTPEAVSGPLALSLGLPCAPCTLSANRFTRPYPDHTPTVAKPCPPPHPAKIKQPKRLSSLPLRPSIKTTPNEEQRRHSGFLFPFATPEKKRKEKKRIHPFQQLRGLSSAAVQLLGGFPRRVAPVPQAGGGAAPRRVQHHGPGGGVKAHLALRRYAKKTWPLFVLPRLAKTWG